MQDLGSFTAMTLLPLLPLVLAALPLEQIVKRLMGVLLRLGASEGANPTSAGLPVSYHTPKTNADYQ